MLAELGLQIIRRGSILFQGNRTFPQAQLGLALPGFPVAREGGAAPNRGTRRRMGWDAAL